MPPTGASRGHAWVLRRNRESAVHLTILSKVRRLIIACLVCDKFQISRFVSILARPHNGEKGHDGGGQLGSSTICVHNITLLQHTDGCTQKEFIIIMNGCVDTTYPNTSELLYEWHTTSHMIDTMIASSDRIWSSTTTSPSASVHISVLVYLCLSFSLQLCSAVPITLSHTGAPSESLSEVLRVSLHHVIRVDFSQIAPSSLSVRICLLFFWPNPTGNINTGRTSTPTTHTHTAMNHVFSIEWFIIDKKKLELVASTFSN